MVRFWTLSSFALLAHFASTTTHAFSVLTATSTRRGGPSCSVVSGRSRRSRGAAVLLHASVEEKTGTSGESKKSRAEEATEKYGLEVGLFQSMKEKDGGESAKSLLKRYGIAYLATSIPLAIISFVLCYVLVDAGVDMAALLSKVGIDAGDAGEKAGTLAVAYAVHKAASPIRFPPTVLLTPVVAKLIGKEPVEEATEEDVATRKE